MVIVGSARIDERGKAHGGRAGDQTGKEVSTQAYYPRYTNPWRVFRFKDPEKAKRAAQGMLAACNNKHIGYDQGGRDTLYNAAKKVGFDPALVTVDCETDCSALIRVLMALVAVFVSTFRTTTEPKVLLDSGHFIELKGLKYTHRSDYLREGDILCTTRQGHTVMVLSNGPKSGVVEVPVVAVAPPAPEKDYMANWITATAPVNLRTGPGTAHKKKLTLPQGAALMFDGAVSGDWYAVMWRGKRHWMSAKFTMVEIHEKPIIDLSTYNVVGDWGAFSEWISFGIFRVAVRHLNSIGPVWKDGRFASHAKGANANRVPFAAYVYSRAKTAAKGVEEAQKAIEWAEPYGPKMYFLDIEAQTCTYEAAQAFLDTVRAKTGKPAGIYIGRMWDEVKAAKLLRDVTWSPYYAGAHGGVRKFGRGPSHPHDAHQYSPAAIYPGGPKGVDVSYINDDPKTNGTGHDILWLRTGGKEGR